MKYFAPALAALTLLPAAALAHTGHDAGTFLAGVAHPVSGVDHVLAMLAVGLWAAQTGGRALWAMPAAFLGAMLAGGAMGSAGLPFLAVEPLILASVIVLGGIVALVARLSLAAALPLIAVFGAAHGWAHGAEAPQAGLAVFAAGFALATAGLHGLGILAGRGLGLPVLRGLGAATVMAGLALAVAG